MRANIRIRILFRICIFVITPAPKESEERTVICLGLMLPLTSSGTSSAESAGDTALRPGKDLAVSSP